jgi:hypothetical protein
LKSGTRLLLLLAVLVRLLLAVLAVVLLAALRLLAALLLSAFIGGTRFVDPGPKGTHAFRVLEPFLGRAGRNEDLNTLSVAAGVRGIKGGILYIHVKN